MPRTNGKSIDGVAFPGIHHQTPTSEEKETKRTQVVNLTTTITNDALQLSIAELKIRLKAVETLSQSAMAYIKKQHSVIQRQQTLLQKHENLLLILSE